MSPDEIDNVSKLLGDHQYRAAALLLIPVAIYWLTNRLKDDTWPTQLHISRANRVRLVLALGAASGIAIKVAAGVPWLVAVVAGLLAALLPMGAHDVANSFVPPVPATIVSLGPDPQGLRGPPSVRVVDRVSDIRDVKPEPGAPAVVVSVDAAPRVDTQPEGK
jgi:hypothetical protein